MYNLRGEKRKKEDGEKRKKEDGGKRDRKKEVREEKRSEIKYINQMKEQQIILMTGPKEKN